MTDSKLRAEAYHLSYLERADLGFVLVVVPFGCSPPSARSRPKARLAGLCVAAGMHRASLQVLGLAGSSPTKAEIKEAYRMQVKLVHPDVSSGLSKTEAEARFMELQKAYEQLLGPTSAAEQRKREWTRSPYANASKEEMRRYNATVAKGGTSIKLMTLLLFSMTAWVAYGLHKKGRLVQKREQWRNR